MTAFTNNVTDFFLNLCTCYVFSVLNFNSFGFCYRMPIGGGGGGGSGKGLLFYSAVWACSQAKKKSHINHKVYF